MKARTFKGGYRFRNFKGQPQNKLVSIDAPRRVVIPLAQGFGTPPDPVVNVGDEVAAGQIIAYSNDRISSPVHSSISGKVASIEKKNYFFREVTMVEIEGGGRGMEKRLEGHSPDWNTLSSQQIEELLYKSGVTSLERSGIPTHLKSSIVGPNEISHLIIHGAESEVYNTSLDIILGGKNIFSFIEGIKILKKIMPNATVHLALNKRKKALIEKIKKLTTGIDNIGITATTSKYPQGYDEVLIPTLLNREFPYGYSAANIGIIVLNFQAVIHVFEAVADGMPLIERTIALCGPGFKENYHIRVRVGTPLKDILEERLVSKRCRIILNSLLTGPELKALSFPIDRTYSQIVAIPEDAEREFLSFLRFGLRADSYSNTFISTYLGSKKIPDTNIYGEPRACIQCGYCISVCPVRIVPTLLDRMARVGINDALMRYGIFKCIDCNLCSYVCPSKIPLSRNIKIGKAKLIETGCDHALCISPRFDLKGMDEYRGLKGTR